jgi:hypothetical protein
VTITLQPSRLAVVAATLFLVPLLGFGQTQTGEIRVSVTDSQGAVVPASLDLSNQTTHLQQNVDNSKDTFTFKSLPLGKYRLLVRAKSFSPVTRIVHLDSEVPVSLNIEMTIQATPTIIEVDDSATLMDTKQTGAAYYIGSQQLKERPLGLAGRGLLDAVAMQPGWVYEANGILHPRGSEYDTLFVINGLPEQDNRSPAFARPVQPDEVQQVKAYTSSIPAEFGHKLGGVVEINTTRNTAPGFHGSASLQAGSFATGDGFLGLQYVTRSTTYTASSEGFTTRRYLDPPTENNFTNRGKSGSGSASVEHNFSDADRLRIAFSSQRTDFQVPDDLLQSAAGQSQERASRETSGDVSYQHIYSPSLLAVVRARVRDVSATLDSDPLSTPVIAAQDRGFREGYSNASLSGHRGRHEWKLGAEASYGSIREHFGYHIVTYQIAGQEIFDPSLPQDYAFAGHALDREQSAYVRDTLTSGPLTFSGGIRYDHYSLLTEEHAFSPRLGIAWSLQQTGTVFHASYDRVFGTPPFENLLVSAARDTRFSRGFFLPIHSARGNYYEVGLSQSVFDHIRMDVNVFDRRVRNFEDDDLLLNTGVSFPIAFDHADIHGVEVKLDAPHMGRFSAFISYSNSVGTGHFPITGGLFLDDSAVNLLSSVDRFRLSQDQRNSGRAWLRYQWTKRLWTAMTGSYNSGLPVEDADELPDIPFLVAQFGHDVVSKVNFDRGSARPSATFNASVGADLYRTDKGAVTLQADVLNITDRLNVINFAGLLSGTAVAPPRSAGLKLGFQF